MPIEKVDRSRWSRESQHSYSDPKHYRDKEYECINCGSRAVYTAREQKRDYEERKVHIHTRRVLCPGCFKYKARVERRLSGYVKEWPKHKANIEAAARFAMSWLQEMERHCKLGGRRDYAMGTFLRRVAAAGRGEKRPHKPGLLSA